MFKWIFKWLFRLLILAVVLVVVCLLSYNSILRVVIEHNIRAQTGMDAEIGSFNLALFSPTITIQNFKLYNSRDFGGTPFLDIPEIYVEYDRAALTRQQVHITLLRLNLGELDIVKNQAGQTNIFALGLSVPSKKSGGGNVAASFKKQTGYDFTGIDTLNVSIGTAKFIDLNDQRNNRTQDIGIEDCVMKNVKSSTDLAGLEALVALRSNGFF
ncbi:MAG TPA: hypothetical protein VMD57_03115, partial [Candidatus Baltobacteraceae bacterium]|nr:hypothetical protein [Candidatus Baltobacteraceae bacterium]